MLHSTPIRRCALVELGDRLAADRRLDDGLDVLDVEPEAGDPGPVGLDRDIGLTGDALDGDVRRAPDPAEHGGDRRAPVLEDVEVLPEELDDELGPRPGHELVDAAGDGLAEGEGHARERLHRFAHAVGQLLPCPGRGPLAPRLEHADVTRLLDAPGLERDPGLAGLADDGHELGEFHQPGLDLAAHVQGLGERDARQELDVRVEGAFVHDGHELRAQARDEERCPGEESDGGDDDDGLVAEAPKQDREIALLRPFDEEASLVRVRLEEQVAERRDGRERQQQRGEQGDDVGESQGQEHLPFDPLQGDDRNEGQGDDELAEDRRLADLEDGPQNDREPAGRRPGFGEVALDVLDLDDRGVDDHADGDGQAAERHQVGRQAHRAHHDEREQHRQRQG
ncbi:MAG: hypothetical protein H6R32_648, partial [Candidatus Aminicenantes bacterium]|nr:hypothetical protein [Candidatus Aminicenantes bacterium]